MEHSEDEQQSIVLQDRLARVNEKWEKVCTQSLAWQHKLQNALMEVNPTKSVTIFGTSLSFFFTVFFVPQNEEFHQVIAELLNWIEETENSIKSYEPIDLTEEKSVIKEKYNKFKVNIAQRIVGVVHSSS